MKKVFFIALMSLIVCGALYAQNYSGGIGTAEDPFQIGTADDLLELSHNPDDWELHFMQTAHIDFGSNEQAVDWDGDGTATWDSGDQPGFSPFGFGGYYDGQGYTISYLFINRPDENYIGLFKHADVCEIHNLGLLNVDITGDDHTEALAGRTSGSTIDGCYSTGEVNMDDTYGGGLIGQTINGSSITNCYSTATVVSTLSSVGGLIGYATSTSNISNCYATGSVSGTSNVGGCIGFVAGGATVSDCYSTGYVSGTSYVGGFLGGINTSTGGVQSSFWNTSTSGTSTGCGNLFLGSFDATGLNTTQMRDYSNFTDDSWDFVLETANGTNDYWDADQDKTVNNGYPILSWQEGSDELLRYSGGVGTSDNKYQIATTADLVTLSRTSSDWDLYFEQTADIDFGSDETAVDWDGDGTASWDSYDDDGLYPIGHGSSTPFTGWYYGNGHTIGNLYIDRPSESYTGLFGYTDGARIYNLGLEDAEITGYQQVGGLIGVASNINNTYAYYCYTTGTVTGNRYVGGLVGRINKMYLYYCYSRADATVTPNNMVGGLVGYNGSDGKINDCYSTGYVSGDNKGGLVGMNYGTVYQNSYWNTTTSGTATGTSYNEGTFSAYGRITSQMQMQSTFSGWDFVGETTNGTNDIWNIDEGNGYPYLSWEKRDVTWTGTTSSEWNNSGNWSGSVIVPTNNLNITIPATANDPNIGPTETADCNNLTVESGGSLRIQSGSSGTGSLIVHGTASGDVTAERYVSADKWHYVSSPVDAVNLATWMPLNNIATETGGQYQFYRWDEDTQYWIYYGYTGTEPENFGDTEFVDASGYCLTTTSDGELSFTGTPITTDVSYSVSNDGNSCHLLGNPFTSTIAITNDGQANDNFLADNTGILEENYQAIYIWNEGESYSYGDNDYSVICNTNFSGQGSGSIIYKDFVEPGQAFMVKVNQAGTIYFNQDIRKHGDADYYKSKESWPGLELTARAENTSNATTIAFNSEMTYGLDPSYDAGKMKANNELSVYTLLVEDNGHQFAVQALPDQNIEDIIVSVGTDITEPIQVEFSIYQENLDNYSIVLEDRQTGTSTNLRWETYATEITQSGTGRFYLHFKDATAIGEIAPETKINFRVLDGKILINNPDQEKGNISLMNLAGQVLGKFELNGNSTQEVTMNPVSEIYIISIQTEKAQVSRKVFIK